MKLRTCSLSVLALLSAAQAASAKNYLVFIMDDVSVDKIGAYAGDYAGYTPSYLPSTPTIDALAASGVRFGRAWATPMCSPTRASFQTGQQPFRTGIGTALGANAGGLVTTNFAMLADAFVANGYTTGLFGKHHIGTRDASGATGYPSTSPFTVEPHPALAGWDRFFGNYDGYPGASGAGYGYSNWKRVGWLKGGTGYTGTETTHATDRTAEVALSWINSRSQPWLAVVAFNAAHSGTTASSVWGYGDVDPTRYRSASLSCLASASCADPTRQSYQGLVEHMDLEIEALLQGMDPAVLADTLIIVFGDNGTPSAVQESVFATLLPTPLSSAGTARGKGTVYENGVRVPLIVADGATWATGAAGPTITAPGRLVDVRVNTLDLYNTLHEDAFGSEASGLDSSSFTDCFTVNGIYCGFVAYRYGYTETFPSNASPNGAKVAVSYGWDTMVAYYDSTNACLEERFFDTSTDPLELSPQAWTGVRADRLRDYFTTMHTGVTSWANPTGAAVVPFCP